MAAYTKLLYLSGEGWSRCQPVDKEQLVGGAAEQTVHVADEPIDVSLARRLVYDVLVVVVAHAAAQLLVVHLGLVLARAPASRNLVRVGHAELPAVARPRYHVPVGRIQQQFQQELPQLDRTAACTDNKTHRYSRSHRPFQHNILPV